MGITEAVLILVNYSGPDGISRESFANGSPVDESLRKLLAAGAIRFDESTKRYRNGPTFDRFMSQSKPKEK